MKQILQHFLSSLAEVSEGLLFPEGPRPFKEETTKMTTITAALRPEADYGDEDPAHSIESDVRVSLDRDRIQKKLSKKEPLDEVEREWIRMRA
jgi:hypothetical protein